MVVALLLLGVVWAQEEPVGAISGAKVRTDWGKEWRWSFGVRGGLAVPLMKSAGSWSLAADKGLVGEMALPGEGLSWVLHFDHTRHTLRDGSAYLVDLPEESGSALDGTATHRWIQTGLRWEPELPPPPGLAVVPVIGGLLGCDLQRTDLEVPTTVGREVVRSVGALPSFAPTAGVNFKVHPNLHLMLGTSFALLFAFDSAEVQSPDRLAVTSRLNTSLEVLGRF